MGGINLPNILYRYRCGKDMEEENCFPNTTHPDNSKNAIQDTLPRV